MGGMRINPRQMQKAMKQMGIKQDTVPDVLEVVIRTKTKEIYIKGADVTCIEMSGQKSYQIAGPETVREIGSDDVGETSAPAVTFSSSDIELVMNQTNCDREKAIEALTAADGQLAEAILKIMTE